MEMEDDKLDTVKMELLLWRKVCHFISMSEVNDAEIPLGNDA